MVLLLGLFLAAFGEGFKPFVFENYRWVQLAIGTTLIALAGLHLLGRTARLPLTGRVMDTGHQLWERVIRDPTRGGSFIYGAGFVLVGVGCTGPFLAAVAAYALGSGGFWTALSAFLIFASTMGGPVALVSILGTAASPTLARTLRRGGRQVQIVAGSLIVLVGATLVFASFTPGIFPNLLLK